MKGTLDDSHRHISQNFLIISFCLFVSSPPGVVRLLKPVIGPSSIDLDVQIEYMKYGLLTHSSEVFIHVIVSEFSF